MAITEVSVSSIGGFISKGSLSETTAGTAVLAQLEGNGAFNNIYLDFISNNIAYKMGAAVGSNLDSNIFASFKCDFAILDGSSLCDLYDSTSNSSCAKPTSISNYTSGTKGSIAGDLTANQTSSETEGGYIAPGSADSSNQVTWTKASKTGTDYETINGSSGKTFCFWYKLKTTNPGAFCPMIADNQTNSGRYSGIIIQRPSNRTSAFTILKGTNGGGTSSSHRRSHLGVNNSLTQDEWQFVVVRAKAGSSTGTTNTYVSITLATEGGISTSNDGVSGTSGSGTTIGYNTSTSATMKWYKSGGVGATAVTEDQIGLIWVLPFGLDASSSYLSDIFDATKQLYGG
tara:strand:+ start:142 stop:1173 length:1032 start_codon:yes stop_codon:yes gene_type:complete